MWQFDFDIYYGGALALAQGLSPYSVSGWYHPLPMALVFLPFVLLPKPLAYGLYLGVCAGLVWRVLKWKSIWVLASFPGFYTLFVGQVDLPLALVTSLAGHWALPLLTSRPHLAFVVAPYLISTTPPKELAKSALASAGVLLACFMLRPGWVQEWLAAFAQPLAAYGRHDSNLYWLLPQRPSFVLVAAISLLALALGWRLRDRRASWTVAHLLAPVTNVYSAAALAEWFGPLETALSWAAIFAVGGDTHSGAPMFIVGLAILARNLWRKIQPPGA